MAHKNTLLQQVQHEITRHVLEGAIGRHFSRGKAQKFSHKSFLTFWLYIHIKGMNSLREAVSSLNNFPERLYHLGFGGFLKLSTISDAMAKRSHLFFKDLFETMLAMSNRRFKKHFAFPLRLMDVTEVFVPYKKFAWDKLKHKTKLLKIHVELCGLNAHLLSVDITSGRIGDISLAKKKTYDPGTILIMDRAYFDCQWWRKLNKNGVIFISRKRTDVIYTTLSSKKIENVENVLEESMIQFIGEDSQAYGDHLRLVTVRHPEKNELFDIITNDVDIPAEAIAALYKQRWQVELFFKWIKQHLKIKRLMGRNENAILIQIWTAMITYLLIWQLHKKSSFAGQKMLNFLRYLKSRMLEPDSRIWFHKQPKTPLQQHLFQKKLYNTGH